MRTTGAESQWARSARGRSLCGIRSYVDCSNARINVNAISGGNVPRSAPKFGGRKVLKEEVAVV
jgi:hypothetical protein